MAASLCIKSCEDHSILKGYNGCLSKNSYSSGPLQNILLIKLCGLILFLPLMIITIIVLIPYELRHFSKVFAGIYTETLSLFYLRGGGGVG